MSVYRLQHQFSLALEQVAEKLGKAPSTISNLARLLQLPDNARQALQEGKISEGHARAMLSLKGDAAKQEELLSCIINNGWTVRQAEQFTTAAKKGLSIGQARSKTASETTLTKDLSQKLGTKVKIKHTAHGGQLLIAFSSDKELQRIVKNISK
jgi:ParB family chromosome partitioning protein